jgi:hypothetical protein
MHNDETDGVTSLLAVTTMKIEDDVCLSSYYYVSGDGASLIITCLIITYILHV